LDLNSTKEGEMKKLLLAATALALASGAAFAADMSMPMKARPAPPPAYSWTGCYVDGGGGYGVWNQSHTTVAFPGGAPLSSEQTAGGRGYYGTIGGGCDYQFPVSGIGNVVVGVLGGYDFMSLKGAFNSAIGPLTSAYEKETGSWDAGGRVGYLVTPNFLTFVSFGYTQAHFNSPTFIGIATTLPSHNYNGWFLGGGAETSLSPWLPVGFFLRSDYKFSTYSAATLQYSTAGAPLAFGERINPYVQQIGTELIYRFNFQ
jgi:outer membrane immunogenic protein